MTRHTDIKWLEEPEEHDFPAAKAYLSLIYDEIFCDDIIMRLRGAKVVEFKAKDIFRASNLSLLGISNSHVAKNVKKISDGKHLSPLLLVRDSVNCKVIIADGYHRLCSIYGISEDSLIPCKII